MLLDGLCKTISPSMDSQVNIDCHVFLFTQLLLCNSPNEELPIYFWDSNFKMFSEEENEGKREKKKKKKLLSFFVKSF
jgi:hypothetical protein